MTSAQVTSLVTAGATFVVTVAGIVAPGLFTPSDDTAIVAAAGTVTGAAVLAFAYFRHDAAKAATTPSTTAKP